MANIKDSAIQHLDQQQGIREENFTASHETVIACNLDTDCML